MTINFSDIVLGKPGMEELHGLRKLANFCRNAYENGRMKKMVTEKIMTLSQASEKTEG